MSSSSEKYISRQKRKIRVRKRIVGQPQRPRLNVFRSARHIYAQIIDDSTGKTLLAASTLEKSLNESISYSGNSDAAAKVGAVIAKRALDSGIKTVVFDRNGFLYHGRIKSLAEAARENGLSF